MSPSQTSRPTCEHRTAVRPEEAPWPFVPYLFFGDNCREAFTAYQEIFGGELTLMAMKDVPGDSPPEQADVIIHAALKIGDDVLMASEDPTTDDFGPVQGMMVSYDAADVSDAERVFGALAEGGTVDQALEPTFFSAGVRHVHRPVRHALDDRGARPEPDGLTGSRAGAARRGRVQTTSKVTPACASRRSISASPSAVAGVQNPPATSVRGRSSRQAAASPSILAVLP